MKSCCDGSSYPEKCVKNTFDGKTESRSRYLLHTAILVLVAIFAVTGVVCFFKQFPSLPGIVTVSEAAAPAVATAAEVVYPVTTFFDGKARFFGYKTASGKNVRYFVIKSSDSVIRAAFDACDVCWESGKGYKQEGDFMVCRNCGRRFQSTKVNVVTGGCNPSALNRTIKDGKVIISAQALSEGARLFN
jgi:uncharacterized membrane protein